MLDTRGRIYKGPTEGPTVQSIDPGTWFYFPSKPHMIFVLDKIKTNKVTGTVYFGHELGKPGNPVKNKGHYNVVILPLVVAGFEADLEFSREYQRKFLWDNIIFPIAAENGAVIIAFADEEKVVEEVENLDDSTKNAMDFAAENAGYQQWKAIQVSTNEVLHAICRTLHNVAPIESELNQAGL